MKLTGKAEKDFNKWLLETFEPEEQSITVHASYEGELETYASDNFYILPFSMRYGVYVDFFSSLDIEISLLKHYSFKNKTTSYFIDTPNVLHYASKDCENRPEARAKAVEKANEIYNNLK